MVQVINDSEYLQLIWDFKPTNEDSKVRSFKWNEIKNIDFIYNDENKSKFLKKIRAILLLIGAFLINAEVAPLPNGEMKDVRMEITLKNGNKYSFDLVIYIGIINSINERLSKNK